MVSSEILLYLLVPPTVFDCSLLYVTDKQVFLLTLCKEVLALHPEPSWEPAGRNCRRIRWLLWMVWNQMEDATVKDIYHLK